MRIATDFSDLNNLKTFFVIGRAGVYRLQQKNIALKYLSIELSEIPDEIVKEVEIVKKPNI